MKKGKRRPTVLNVRPAGPDHQVVSLQSSGTRYMKRPCKACPWRKDAVGVFPAEAFRHSAETAYDMSTHVFACHTAGAENSCMCAGFLMVGADHNLMVRLKRMEGTIRNDVTDGGHELHASYRDMAVANGVDPSDPVLAQCRARHGYEQ